MPINRIRLDDVDVRNLSATTSLLNTAIGQLSEDLEKNIVQTGNDINKLQTDIAVVQGQFAAKANINDPVFTGTVVAGSALVTNEVLENVIVSGSSVTGTVNVDFSDSATYFYTSNASGNWTFNFRASSIFSLNNYLNAGQLITATILVTNGGTPFRATGFQVDGTNVTVRWADGLAPATGNANSVDIYTFSIIKTANAAFTVFGSLARFA